jgi:hypothetical protein
LNRSDLLSRKTVNFGKVCRISRRIRHAGLALLALAPLSTIARGDDPPRAQLPDGKVVTGHLDGKNPATLVFVVAGSSRKVPLASIPQIHFRPRPRFIEGTTPPRRILLRGGESLHAETLSVEEAKVSLRAFGGEPQFVPREALAAVLQPAGLRLVAYEDFESRPILFDSGRLDSSHARSGRQSLIRRPGDDVAAFVLERPLAAGRVDLLFYDTGTVGLADEWSVEFEFGAKADSSVLRFLPGWSDPEYRCTSSGDRPLARQRVARSAGWRRLMLLIDARQFVLLVDGQVLATGSSSAALAVIRCGPVPVSSAGDRSRAEKPAPADDAPPAGWIDDLQVFEQAEEQPAPRNSEPADLVWLGGGDELFGQVQGIDQRGILLDGKFGRRRFPWSELRGVVFPPARSSASKRVEGLVAEIELAPVPGADTVPNDHLVVALRSLSQGELHAQHPALGELRIPVREINRIAPKFAGSLIVIDPAFHHLGDAIREDFHAQPAEGTRLEWKVRLEAVPKSRGFISLRAADLEPRGARPHEGPGHEASATGELSTELLVNGRRVADLNRFVSIRSIPANPQRLRISLPAGLLKAGDNVIRLAQRPERDDSGEFDDCEISRLALEFEP